MPILGAHGLDLRKADPKGVFRMGRMAEGSIGLDEIPREELQLQSPRIR